MSLKFPFEYARVEGLGKLFYPVVRLAVKTVSGWVDFKFLVDTGADVTTFPSHFLPVLGLNKKTLPSSYFSGVGGYKVRTWNFKFPLMIGRNVVNVSAAAIESRNGTEPLLLGKDVFEDKFNLFLNSKNKMVEITKN